MASSTSYRRDHIKATAEEVYQGWLESIVKEEHEKSFHTRQANQELRTNLFRDGAFTDVVLRGSDSDIPINCHRFVLAEHSPVFQRMFTSGFAENGPNSDITMENVPYDILKKLTNFLYSGDIKISGDEVMILLEFADKYDINVLKKMGVNMLLSNIKPYVCMKLWSYLKVFNCPKTSEKAVKAYVLDNFTHNRGIWRGNMARYIDFLESDIEGVAEILQDAGLTIDDESDVFDVCFKWVVFDLENRHSELTKLWQNCIRRKFIRPDLVIETINQLGQDRLSNELKESLLRFMQEIGPSGCYDVKYIQEPRRNTKEVEGLIITLVQNDTPISVQPRLVFWKPDTIEFHSSTDLFPMSNVVHAPDTFIHENDKHYIICTGELLSNRNTINSFYPGTPAVRRRIHVRIPGTDTRVNPCALIIPDQQNAMVIAQAPAGLFILTVRIPSRESSSVSDMWECPCPFLIPYDLDPALHVIYKGWTIFFDTKNKGIVFFNRKTCRHQRYDFPLKVGSNAKVCREGNIAVLIDRGSIDVIHLDPLLAQFTAPYRFRPADITINNHTSERDNTDDDSDPGPSKDHSVSLNEPITNNTSVPSVDERTLSAIDEASRFRVLYQALSDAIKRKRMLSELSDTSAKRRRVDQRHDKKPNSSHENERNELQDLANLENTADEGPTANIQNEPNNTVHSHIARAEGQDITHSDGTRDELQSDANSHNIEINKNQQNKQPVLVHPCVDKEEGHITSNLNDERSKRQNTPISDEVKDGLLRVQNQYDNRSAQQNEIDSDDAKTEIQSIANSDETPNERQSTTNACNPQHVNESSVNKDTLNDTRNEHHISVNSEEVVSIATSHERRSSFPCVLDPDVGQNEDRCISNQSLNMQDSDYTRQEPPSTSNALVSENEQQLDDSDAPDNDHQKPTVTSFPGPKCRIQSSIIWGQYFIILNGIQDMKIHLSKIALNSLITAKPGSRFKWEKQEVPLERVPPDINYKHGILGKGIVPNPSCDSHVVE